MLTSFAPLEGPAERLIKTGPEDAGGHNSCLRPGAVEAKNAANSPRAKLTRLVESSKTISSLSFASENYCRRQSQRLKPNSNLTESGQNLNSSTDSKSTSGRRWRPRKRFQVLMSANLAHRLANSRESWSHKYQQRRKSSQNNQLEEEKEEEEDSKADCSVKLARKAKEQEASKVFGQQAKLASLARVAQLTESLPLASEGRQKGGKSEKGNSLPSSYNNNNNNINNISNKYNKIRISQMDQKGIGRQTRRSTKIDWLASRLPTPSFLFAIMTGALLIIMTHLGEPVAAVDCFKCSSRNGSNPACEDPFHNLNTTRITVPILPDPLPSVIYHASCYAGKKGKEGLFPASACIKLTGVFDFIGRKLIQFQTKHLCHWNWQSAIVSSCEHAEFKDTTGETLVVRHCALDSGTLTQDTELARMSHCGKFQFEGDLLQGCVLACPEDACNSVSPSDLRSKGRLYLITALIVILNVILKAQNS